MSDMKKLRQEVFQVLFFDKKWNYISGCRISAGTVDRTLVHPREVFYNAIKNLASAVVLAHNHPSGDCTPSKADYDTTERMVKAGRIVGIDVADHMIVGNGTYYSMYREGDLIKIKEKTLNEGLVVMARDIGIDLGTANTLVHMSGKGIIIREPSVVAINKNTNEVLAVGDAAKRMIGRTPEAL